MLTTQPGVSSTADAMANTNAPSITPIAPASNLEALPYSAAIAQWFADPAERYSTPGLEAGRTDFTTNAEIATLLRELSSHATQGVRLGAIAAGSSQNGQPIWALIATRANAITPLALEENQRPTVMIVAGQQGTDHAPTEALLAMAKELGEGGLLSPLLQQLNIVLVPRANPDGFELQQPHTADGTDLRQDHLVLKTPEARMLAKLARDYRPAVLVDAGEFNALEPTLSRFGAVRANDAGLQYAVTPNGHEFITKAAREWLHEPTVLALSQAQLRADWAFENIGADAQAGFSMGTLQPTTLRNASSLKNVASLAVLSRGADIQRSHIQRRVHTHVKALTAVLQSSYQRAANLRQIHSFVVRDVASQACKGPLVTHAQPLREQREVSLLDAQTAQTIQPQVAWQSALGMQQPTKLMQACGYWLSANAVQAAERLNMLGVNVQRIAELSPLRIEAFQATAGTQSLPAAPTVQRLPAQMDATPGSYYVSMNQPLAYLAAAALEPDTPFSYFSHGVLGGLNEVARVVSLPNLVFDEE